MPVCSENDENLPDSLADMVNLRAALRRLIGEGDSEGALRPTIALGRFCYIRGHLQEGVEYALALP